MTPLQPAALTPGAQILGAQLGQQLFLILKERIERGLYAPGAWLPAERALADEFRLDRSAVRRALLQLADAGLIVREPGRRPWVRGGPSAMPPASLSGTQTAGQIGRRRPRPARLEETGLRTIVAILPQHPQYPASLAILHGINAALRSAEAPFRLQVIDTHGGSDNRETQREQQALASVMQERIAGAILWQLGGPETVPPLRELEARGIPVVFVDRFPPEIACDFVGGDNQAGIETAFDYLRDLGHRRIAHLTADEQSTAVLQRRDAYMGALTLASIPLDPDLIFAVSHTDTAHVAPACDHFFSLADPPTAVLAMNDPLAYRFIAECVKRGIRVPEDISVVGFDDLEQHSPRPSLLTTLHQPFDKMGRRAAEMLLSRLSTADAAPPIRRHVLLPTPLIARATCRAI